MYDNLVLQICRRDRKDNQEKPGCYYNLPYKDFCQWEWEIYDSFPGITIQYSEKKCLGLCPCEGISVQIDSFPTVVHSLDEIQQHINAYILTTT